ncbi:succinoglycan biosynthesis protein exop [Mesorhizobium sp. M2D.F.Ca.ET.185.01.1.1]|uniref:GumC family protein n=1 Tax=unclassified Mesorhizobium TaxID=325217 RepID=UPI000FCA2E27|nr:MULTISPECIES: GumC family protein [unclassified Mesorhizobium]TGP74431.1 succinoglycan biosynthesis protein exop [bacterium M00.F.Ca.ET.227.01.1.1]TGP85117.1 succinoglycan biosynthesis protein exop [bacterium M00.F.Ca.ET.221.01.1.1]TGP89200.1 succinoglycan biosynthesis protein exop [bacterium M00.F.Ca.ET.222.01.1.1]TGU12727.1 succinoglycan biosynthesis protein exop [bacterium M00.F.Ca.ET.163.01.1.1]TGU21355.1 succinoglycan biosynthesis protein exop [bacterium M00.F.Ca.ET.156.01.1.1]TGU4376
MVDRDNRDDWRRERSLLALGQAMRGEDNTVAIGDRANSSWREDAAARHRAARSEREAKSNPQPAGAGDLGSDQTLLSADPVKTADAWAGGDRQASSDQGHEAASAGSRPQATRDPHYPSRPSAADDSQEWKPLIDPMQVVHGVIRSKALILSTTILGAALGVAIALSTPKKYEATTDVIVDPRDLKLTDRDLTQNVVASDATLAIVENQVRILTSGTVLNKVVTDLNLTNDPEFNGQGKGGLGLMSTLRSILSRQDAGPADEARKRALAVGNLADCLDVERGGKTFVVSVSATTQNAEKSALIANTMVKAFKQISSEIQSSTAGRANDELTARLDELRKGVETAERNVEDFRATHDLVDAQGHLISDDQMLKLNEQLSVARARTLELNARAASARSLNVNSVLSGTLPEEINSNMMSELRSQYAALKQEADRAEVKLGPRHPEIEALNAQLAGARERIGAELQRIASSLQVDLKRSVQLEQDLSSRLAQAKVQSGDVNNNLVSLRELEREAAAKRSVYEQFLLRAKETGEQKDINTANISVISDAYAPLQAKGPSRAVMALAGLFAGLFAGIGLGALRGILASLRETADGRSRRRVDERVPMVENSSNRAAPPAPPLVTPPPVVTPPPAPPVAPPPAPSFTPQRPAPSFTPPPTSPAAPQPVSVAAPPAAQPVTPPPMPDNDAGRPGLFGSLASALRYFVRREPADTVDLDSVPPESAWRAPSREERYSRAETPARENIQPPYEQGYSYSYRPDHARSDPYEEQYPASPAAYHPQPQPAGEARQPAADQGEIDDIRASLREFREAVRELTENRSRRRYF